MTGFRATKQARWLRTTVLGLVCLLIVTGALGAQNVSETRTALLIANNTYRSFGNLANPVPEARSLAAALRRIGFDVTVVENAGRERMLDEIQSFEQSLRRRGGIAFFHYGGHAVQVDGRNYLIPSDVDIPDERRVRTRAVDAAEIMAALDASGAETSIVVLDACRNNPLPAVSGRSATRGLTRIDPPRNSIVVFSAESDSVAQDGVFTPALTRMITRPGLSLTDMLIEVRREVLEQTMNAQRPGEYSQLVEQVYLAGLPRATSPAARPGFEVERTVGSIRVTVETAGTVYLDGERIGQLQAGQSATVSDVETGDRRVEVRYADGERETSTVAVRSGTAATARFSYVERLEPDGYQIGDRGPAGGIVFYDKGRVSGGWQYLEAAPEDLGSMNWNDAIRYARNFRFGEFSDWRLPTKDELGEMYKQRRIIEGFTSTFYWSSSEYLNVNAWTQSFLSGRERDFYKQNSYRVRVIRAF